MKRGTKKLSEPVTFRQAAKLLGTSLETVELMVDRLILLTIEVRGKPLIPASEVRRFMPR